jgi:2-polyprenyl-6-methoxyphenol hydroxylase-like FAD-dependent oxidoreductase
VIAAAETLVRSAERIQMPASHDVIVVGTRCAGSPTAMLLARAGHRVLMVDRASFPSDTMSTHLIHPPGVAALERWGLLDRLAASGCPPIGTYRIDFGPFAVAAAPEPAGAIANAYAPRRTVLDKLLVDAAVEAGAELREGFTVSEVLVSDGTVTGIRGRGRDGVEVTERARVVVGADGLHSAVARAVAASPYHQQPTLEASYYAYWSGLETEGFEGYIRPERSWAAFPTHDDLTVVIVGWPRREFEANRADVEGNYLRMFEMAPEFAERIRAATRESRFVGTGDLPNFFRTPYGPGWALVGDAGYHKDPLTAQGISDAFRDAELLAVGLDRWLAAGRPFEDEMADYQNARDSLAMPMFELTCQLASMEPPGPELGRLLAALPGNQRAMTGFVSVIAGTVPVPEFFAPANVQEILAAAGSAAAPEG